MSNRPDNPFQQGGPGTMYADRQPKKSGSNVWLWVLGIVGGLIVIGALVCCGVGYFGYQAATNMLAEAFKGQLQGNPVIVEHVGEIESLKLNLTKTQEQAQSSNGMMAFDLVGAKGSATLLIRQSQGGDGMGIDEAVLLMPDGTKHDIPITAFGDDFGVEMGDDAGDGSQPTAGEEFEIQLNEFNTPEPAPAP
jgi:hypothetical protein